MCLHCDHTHSRDGNGQLKKHSEYNPKTLKVSRQCGVWSVTHTPPAAYTHMPHAGPR